MSHELDAVTIRRYVHRTVDPRYVFRVTAYAVTPIDLKQVRSVSLSMEEYKADCKLHDNCKGHISYVDGKGPVMPQGFAVEISEAKSVALKAAEILVNGRGVGAYQAFRDTLLASLLGKRGLLRYHCMGGPVDGSLRSVIVGSWELEPNTIAVPSYIFKTLAFPCSEGGAVSKKYVSSARKALVVRPPTLWAGNAQIMNVTEWDGDCIRFPSYRCEEYHADFDGDEIQITPLRADFEHPPVGVYDVDARKERCMCGKVIDVCDVSTVPISGQNRGQVHEDVARMSRIKTGPLALYNDLSEGKARGSWYDRCVSGMSDIIKQQCTQGIVGHMSRRAKAGIAAGAEHIMCEMDVTVDDRAALRATSVMCARLQQESLDVHRVDSGVQRLPLCTVALFGTCDYDGSKCTVIVTEGAARYSGLSRVVDMSIDGNCVMVILEDDVSLWLSALVGTEMFCHPDMIAQLGHARGYSCVSAFVQFAWLYSGIDMALIDIQEYSRILCYTASRGKPLLTCIESRFDRDSRPLMYCVSHNTKSAASNMDVRFRPVRGLIDRVLMSEF